MGKYRFEQCILVDHQEMDDREESAQERLGVGELGVLDLSDWLEGGQPRTPRADLISFHELLKSYRCRSVTLQSLL